ncbi:hypothetical protein [Acrocarpospora catenulata]|uniref:hypothetical protein n=1 Tax=Acrocarpospora catenulata TaxID=2836182 RepID=UPI001BDB66C7|nr:hypothetical protein [Acrocarpospora catenulata]
MVSALGASMAGIIELAVQGQCKALENLTGGLAGRGGAPAEQELRDESVNESFPAPQFVLCAGGLFKVVAFSGEQRGVGNASRSERAFRPSTGDRGDQLLRLLDR